MVRQKVRWSRAGSGPPNSKAACVFYFYAKTNHTVAAVSLCTTRTSCRDCLLATGSMNTGNISLKKKVRAIFSPMDVQLTGG